MPTLKQITCALEVGPNGTRLKEYGHHYTDGGVEAYVAVPDSDIPFRIRVVSNGYIAPGLAAYAFMDGQYQCNRNRSGMLLPSRGMDPREYEVDFLMRQREEKTSSKDFVAREWTFSQLNTACTDVADTNKHFTQNVGTIEVLILRCKGGTSQMPPPAPEFTAPPQKPVSVARAPSAKAAAKAESAAEERGDMLGLFDGAGDDPDATFAAGLDGAHDEADPGGRYAPSYFVRRGPQPEYRWDPRAGTYEHDLDELYERRRSVYMPDETPAGYERVDAFRPRPDVDSHPPSAKRPRSDFVYIEEVCNQIEGMLYRGQEETQKHANMDREAYAHRHDPDLYPIMLRALQRKAQDIRGYNREIEDMYRSIKVCMREMDDDSFQKVRAFLIDRRLLPEVQIEMLRTPQETPIQERHRPARRPSTSFSRPAGDWQEVGQGQSLWERKQRQLQQLQQNTPNAYRNGADNRGESQWGNPALRQNNGDAWGTPQQQDDDDMDGTKKWATPAQQDPKDAAWGAQMPGTFPTPQVSDNAWPGQEGAWGSAEKSNASQKSPNKDDQWDNDKADESPGYWPGDDWKHEDGDNAAEADNSDGGEEKASDQGRGDAWGAPDSKDQGGNGGACGADQCKDQGAGGDACDKPKSNPPAANAGGNDGAPSGHSKQRSRATVASSALRPAIKEYWGRWNDGPRAPKPRTQPRDPYNYSAPAPPAVSKSVACAASQYVQPGRGTHYAHKLARPEYIDSFAQPYAIFTFKYRSKSSLEKILGRNIDTSNIERAMKETEHERLMRLPKDELVAELLRKQTLSNAPSRAAASKPGGDAKAPSKAPSKTPTKAPSKAPTAAAWGEPVKPSDSVSQKDWQEVGQGQAHNAWNHDGGKSKSDSDRGKEGGRKKASQPGGWNTGWEGADNVGGGGARSGSTKKSHTTTEHFAGDQDLKQTGDNETENDGWAAVEW